MGWDKDSVCREESGCLRIAIWETVVHRMEYQLESYNDPRGCFDQTESFGVA